MNVLFNVYAGKDPGFICGTIGHVPPLNNLYQV
ncbi:Uncharacterised protein [Klebsiella pneumoniae]|nr:Uncharacterised protein [Klebsiella pneumoniae]